VFASPWGHLLHGYMHEESPVLVKNRIRLADCHGRLSVDHGFNYLGTLRELPGRGAGGFWCVCRLVGRGVLGRRKTRINLDVRQLAR